LALQVRGLVLEMKDEPELEARVRYGQIDVVPVREVDGSGEVGVLVAIEDAPYLVVGPPAPSPRVASFGPLGLNCSLDELQGAASIGVDLSPYSVTVLAAPIREIELLGTKALYEHEQIEQNCGP
jgi:hypothetical protein